jgi:hypothetical protein
LKENIQVAIANLIRLGPLPSSGAAAAPVIQAFEEQLSKANIPISDDEARVLVRLFGPDDCFGLAWTLLHLIETSPNWLIEDALNGLEGDWIERLRERAAQTLIGIKI